MDTFKSEKYNNLIFNRFLSQLTGKETPYN